MDFPSGFNTYNNINYKQRSKTLQPDKKFLMEKFFEKLSEQQERANYANVPVDSGGDSIISQNNHMLRPHQLRSHHQSLHSRSHSHHYCHTMPYSPPANDLNNYYNISNVRPPLTRSRHSQVHEAPSPPVNTCVEKLDCLAVMHVCNELGNNVDSAPPLPSSRKYSIAITNQGLFKVAFPQIRTMKGDYFDPTTRTLIKAGDLVSVSGASKEDRGKFDVYHYHKCISLPHQLTLSP